MDGVPTVGLIATVLSSAAFLPQCLKTLLSGHTADQSLLLYVLLIAAGVFWYFYGLETENKILQVSSISQLGLISSVLLVKLSNVFGGVDSWT